MNPSSAMALASMMPGHSALACALAGTGFVVATDIAARAAERRRSRFVNIFTSPHAEWGWFSDLDAANERPDVFAPLVAVVLASTCFRLPRLSANRGAYGPGLLFTDRSTERRIETAMDGRRRRSAGVPVNFY